MHLFCGPTECFNKYICEIQGEIGDQKDIKVYEKSGNPLLWTKYLSAKFLTQLDAKLKAKFCRFLVLFSWYNVSRPIWGDFEAKFIYYGRQKCDPTEDRQILRRKAESAQNRIFHIWASVCLEEVNLSVFLCCKGGVGTWVSVGESQLYSV